MFDLQNSCPNYQLNSGCVARSQCSTMLPAFLSILGNIQVENSVRSASASVTLTYQFFALRTCTNCHVRGGGEWNVQQR